MLCNFKNLLMSTNFIFLVPNFVFKKKKKKSIYWIYEKIRIYFLIKLNIFIKILNFIEYPLHKFSLPKY